MVPSIRLRTMGWLLRFKELLLMIVAENLHQNIKPQPVRIEDLKKCSVVSTFTLGEINP